MVADTLPVIAVVDAAPAIRKIVTLDTLPLKFCFDLELMLPAVEEIISVFERQKLALIVKHGGVAVTGDTYEITSLHPNYAAFKKDFDELAAVYVPLVFPTIAKEFLIDLPKGLSTTDIRNLRQIRIIV